MGCSRRRPAALRTPYAGSGSAATTCTTTTPSPTDDGTLTARIVLEDDPRAPATARRFLREFLQRVEVSDDVAATAELCLSELVTNAIVHAGGRSELRATIDTALTVSVRDQRRPGAGRRPR